MDHAPQKVSSRPQGDEFKRSNEGSIELVQEERNHNKQSYQSETGNEESSTHA
tara:strand:+ start:195 stop:353 length:159 start_codon:yes stop_codon:yes gene_type:complete